MTQELPRKCCGFTLIELLVVVTIIVVLLALLAPGLDKAVYQAELASCAARLETSAKGFTQYASAQRRMYPTRFPPSGVWAQVLNYPTTYDLRAAMRDYMPIKAWVDPLAPVLDLEVGPGNDVDTIVSSHYQIYAGWTFAGLKGMVRLGDRLTSYVDPGLAGVTHDYNVIIGDRDEWQTNVVTVCHPDDKGIMHTWAQQNVNNPWAFGLPGTGKYTIGWWWNDASPVRGAIDVNFASTDGSVERYLKVEMKEPERMGKTPEYGDNSYYQDPRWVHLPLR